MELQTVSPNEIAMHSSKPAGYSTDKPFIQANTIESTLEEIKREHIIPVFLKDNEPVISHTDFIEAALNTVHKVMSSETILSPLSGSLIPLKAEYQRQRTNQPKSS